jgi:xylulokinase
LEYLLGVDLGTTSLKVSLFSEIGHLIGSESCEYPIDVPEAGYAEQDPLAWWDGFLHACQQLKQRSPQEFNRIAGIGICGQMHTQVYLDKEDRILRPAITWMDQRSSSIVDRINQDEQACRLIFEETSNFASTTYTALHTSWVREHQPEIWAKVDSILVAKDYLKYRLTGRKITDFAEASGTLVFDVGKEAWSPAAFDYFAIPPSFFPDVLPCDEIIGKVSHEAAQLTGIKEGTPVANGSSDNSASALGAGMYAPGQVTLIIGTAGVITVCSDHPLVDHQNRTLCWHYCLRDRWATLGITQTAGESLHWFKNAFDQQDAPTATSGDIFNRYNETIQTVPDGSGGLIFLPYLNGERTPYWDPAARGVFYGINLKTEKAHFIKAIMEGVSFALRNNIETVESLGIHISEVRAVGGGLKSPVWLETLAKILKKPVTTVNAIDTANLGNILLCGKALGIYPSYADALTNMVTTGRQVDFPDGVGVYEKQYEIFLDLYQQLKPAFRRSVEQIGVV